MNECFVGFALVSKWISYDMFKVRTVLLGKILTFSTAVSYLGYLWYKRKRTLLHHQSDKKKSSSEPSGLTKVDEQEILKVLEKTSCTLEESKIVEEPIEVNCIVCEEIMEPAISQVEMKETESFVDNMKVQELDLKTVTMSNDQQVCIESNINKIEALAENMKNFKLHPEENKDTNKMENVTEVVNTVVDSTNIYQVNENCETKKELSKNVDCCSTLMVNNEDHCECPQKIIKKVKKDDEPMLFEGIKFKGKKKKGRKKNQAKETIKLPSDIQNKDNEMNVTEKPTKTNQMVEEDCDSAHSIDHSIDTNDAPNTIYSDIRSVVSVLI